MKANINIWIGNTRRLKALKGSDVILNGNVVSLSESTSKCVTATLQR